MFELAANQITLAGGAAPDSRAPLLIMELLPLEVVGAGIVAGQLAVH